MFVLQLHSDCKQCNSHITNVWCVWTVWIVGICFSSVRGLTAESPRTLGRTRIWGLSDVDRLESFRWGFIGLGVVGVGSDGGLGLELGGGGRG